MELLQHILIPGLRVSLSFGPCSPYLGPSLLYCWFGPSLPLEREQLAAQLWAHSSSASPRVGFHWTNLGHAPYSEPIMAARGNEGC